MANTPQQVQQALNNIEGFCDKWKLEVNCSKTKVTVFGENVKDQSKYNFMYKGEQLEVVNNFKYLGVTFTSKGSFKMCITDLKQQASRAMYSLIAKSRKLKLPIDLQISLFDATVLPIMLYGCEVWGTEKIEECEVLYRKFLKYILHVRTSTSSAMVYGETGCFPISIAVKKRMISYWIRLLTGKRQKMIYIVYNCFMSNMNNNNSFKSPWIKQIKKILDECGMSDVWLNQETLFVGENSKSFAKHICKQVEQWLKDQFIQ